MLKITNVLNPLTGGATTDEHAWVKGQPLSQYMGYDGECVVSCNGAEIDRPLTEILPAHGEEYMVMIVPEGGDKQTLRILGYAGMGVVQFIPGWGPIASFVGSNLINLFLQDKEKSQSTSESYGWEYRDSPAASLGKAMPVVYGKARVRPIMKNRYVTKKDDEQRLYALYGLAAHKVDATTYAVYTRTPTTPYQLGDIVTVSAENGTTYRYKSGTSFTTAPSYTDTDYWELWHGTGAFADSVIVNGCSISNYNADVEWETRPGLPSQTVIEGFDVTYANTAQNEELYFDGIGVINSNEANMNVMPRSTVLRWKQHTLYVNGVTYPLASGRKATFGSSLNYIYFEPATSTEEYQVADVEPTGAGQFLVATLQGGAVKPNGYPGIDNYAGDADWTTFTLPLTAAHNIEIIFEFPNGLYGAPAGQNIVSATGRVFAQYREVGGTWTNFYSKFGDPGYFNLNGITGVKKYSFDRKNSKTFSISMRAVAQLHALNYSKSYEIRVSSSSPAIARLTNIATITYGAENADGTSPGFTYPGEPLLGIRALASGQINGDLDVQVDVERSYVWVYNTRNSTWVQGAADNHAWAVYDILANGHPDHKSYPTAGNADAEAIYGCGINKDRLDYETFRTWAENIGELDYELNIVFDTFMTAWDAILRICQEGRGMVYPIGTKIYAFTDKAEDVSQLFTMGNIHAGTFVQKFMEANQKVNMVEVNYYDAEREYQRTTIAARSADWDSTTGLSVPTTVSLYGTTSNDQAQAIARFLIIGNELINNVITFGVDVDALAAQAGDVVEVQHDVLTVGQGGRIVDVVYNYIVNGSFESALLPDWIKWASPSVYGQSTNQSKYATYSLHTRSTSDNGGGQQTFTVKPNTEYTLSAWVYMLNVSVSTATIRAMTLATGSPNSKASANKTLLNQWQRVSVTFTTAATQTTATVWLGGIGEAYFDGVMFNEGATAIDFSPTVLITVDRDLELSAGVQYQLKVRAADGTLLTQTGITTENQVSAKVLSFGSSWAWTTVPVQYDPYSFGITGAHVKKYRIADISRTNELMRTLTLVAYDADIYASYTPNDIIPEFDDGQFTLAKLAVSSTTVKELANLLNIATNLQLREVISRNRTTGEYESSIVATWDTVQGDPRGAWEVWFRDVDGSDVDWEGTWSAGTFDLGKKVELDGKAYISTKDSNVSTPFTR